MPELGAHYLETCLHALRAHKRLADGALAQLDADEIRRSPANGSNSIAVVMKHMAGNMISRWTDFLTSDGEKPWRERDDEFIDGFGDSAALLAHWERGWAKLFETVAALRPTDLLAEVRIRGEAHTVLRALTRQVGHYGYHVGQIAYLARMLVGSRWRSLSIPVGESDEFNRRKGFQP